MSSTANLVFVFIALGMVIGGVFVIANGFVSEPTPGTTIPSVHNSSTNNTVVLVNTVGVIGIDVLIPAMILLAAVIAIVAISIAGRKRR